MPREILLIVKIQGGKSGRGATWDNTYTFQKKNGSAEAVNMKKLLSSCQKDRFTEDAQTGGFYLITMR